MKKLLPERLREFAANDGNYIQDLSKMMGVELAGKAFGTAFRESINKIADEIERCYIPRPRFENGEPVQLGDYFVVDLCKGEEVVADANYVVAALDGSCCYLLSDYDGYMEDDSYRFKRPTPKALDADGVPCEAEETVWNLKGEELKIEEVSPEMILCYHLDGSGAHQGFDPSEITHERPVLDADRKPIKLGDTVYILDTSSFTHAGSKKHNRRPMKVRHLPDYSDNHCAYKGAIFIYDETLHQPDSFSGYIKPEHVTHEKPVFDAEGERIRKGETVWTLEGLELIVTSIGEGQRINVREPSQAEGHTNYISSYLTHREPDTWDALYGDMLVDDKLLNRTQAEAWVDRIEKLRERGA